MKLLQLFMANELGFCFLKEKKRLSKGVKWGKHCFGLMKMFWPLFHHEEARHLSQIVSLNPVHLT